jgi:short-subunit dehydrogenase
MSHQASIKATASPTPARDEGFVGSSALVTGSSRGLGFLIARELATRGCRVLMCARDGDTLSRAADRLRAQGADVHAMACDLRDKDTAERLRDRATELYGGVDILVNNAGTIKVGPLTAMREADFSDAMETMCLGPLRLMLGVIPGMRERGGGMIINVTSLGGRIAAPHLLPYVGAKFALTGISEGMRAELAADGISVTTVIPGLMRTGSHLAADFHGRPEREYAWFALAAGLPLVSMDAERAARAIVHAAQRRRPEVVLGAVANIAVRMHGLAPATTTRALTIGARLLRAVDNEPDSRRGQNGRSAAQSLDSRLLGRLTTLNDRAARRFNQPVS